MRKKKKKRDAISKAGEQTLRGLFVGWLLCDVKCKTRARPAVIFAPSRNLLLLSRQIPCASVLYDFFFLRCDGRGASGSALLVRDAGN